jgi:hypothetical protein
MRLHCTALASTSNALWGLLLIILRPFLYLARASLATGDLERVLGRALRGGAGKPRAAVLAGFLGGLKRSRGWV